MADETAKILVEFLEVAITSIVYVKGIYPTAAFERRRYLNVVVQRAKHPELRDYIHTAVTSLLPFIPKGLVERVAVVFFNNDCVPVERFIFKLTVSQSNGLTVEESGWEIISYFREIPEIGTSKDAELWIPTDTKQWQQPPRITPVKSMSSEPLCLQLYVEHPSVSEPKSEEENAG